MQAKKLSHKVNISERQQVLRLQALRISELNRSYQQQLRHLRHVVRVIQKKQNLSSNVH
jgi:hypothetical protein